LSRWNPDPARALTIGGILALGLVLPVHAPAQVVPLTRPATIDTIVTGALGPQTALPANAQAQALPPAAPAGKGSSQFQAALAQLDKGEAAQAYGAARGLANATERRTLQWAAIYYGDGEIDHDSVSRYMADAPDFVAQSVFRSRLERALNKANPPSAEVIRLLGGAMPNTFDARIALAEAYVADGQRDRAAAIARSLWVDNFLDRATEDKVRQRLGSLLTREDHWKRAVHLMMNDRASGVERLLDSLTPAQKSLAIARNAVSRRENNAKALLDNVDPSMRQHPVYVYSRVQRARQADLYESAVDWLGKASGELPDASEWWTERRLIVRRLLADGKPELAYRAAAGFTHGPEGRVVEAQFHAGWIALSFLNDPARAKGHFEAMASKSTLPDTVTQSNFWLGRSLLLLGDAIGARAAFETAAAYSTVYYGQLARAELGQKSVELRGLPSWQSSQQTFESRPVVQGIRLLAANGQQRRATPLLRQLAQSLQDPGELLLAARLAQELGAHNVAIAIADTAEKRGAPLDLFSFPKDGIPANIKVAEVDMAAVYAVARQESLFQVDAVSSAGARGLMQLMPATAKETAQKLGVDYSPNRLTSDPAYNALLGSTYLAAQLDRFDGSLVLAAAAYNAGGGNASKWINAYGDPRSERVDPVVWVELIPFDETRKYVQRVLGNYLVYRARMGDDTMSITQALRAIPH